jgi:hypothetical protein
MNPGRDNGGWPQVRAIIALGAFHDITRLAGEREAGHRREAVVASR